MASQRLYRDYILEESVAPRRSLSINSKTPSNPAGGSSRTTSPRTTSPRTLSPRTTSSRTTSPRTVISDHIYDERKAGSIRDRFRDHGLGLSEPVEDEKEVLVHDEGIGIAQTLDGNEKANGRYDNDIGIARTVGGDETDSLDDVGTSIAQETEDGTSTAYGDGTHEPVLHQAQIDQQSLDLVSPGFNPRRTLARSMTSMSDVSRSQQITQQPSGASKLPEFFSQATFQIVLHNPTIAHQLLLFGQSRLCGENLEFLGRVSKYHAMLAEVSKSIYEIHKEFISNNAPNQLNLTENLLVKTNNSMKTSLASTLPALENVFVDAQNDIERLTYTDIYPNFVRHQMSVSAAKALGGDRAKYAGLGDCFVLTDPAKADNPIVYASDGFVKVTGYQRNEIIPRNCRFLQSRYTDRSVVRRLKTSIDNRQGSVELLLNEKKNGEPFWNLLYVTPLYDGNGKLAFFLGGQINCSTTIHSASDVLRILGQSKDVDEEPTPGTMSPPVAKASRRSILSAFRSNSRQNIQPRAPGMENTLLDRIGDKPLKDQMDTFHTAYSNFIVINHSSYLIAFVSAGIIDLLFPIKAKTAYHAQAVGADIFKFLGNHGSGSTSWDFKSAVKGSLKMGQPISLEMKLCARPYMGIENFVLHWTPLKDDRGSVHWIVLTLGNERRV